MKFTLNGQPTELDRNRVEQALNGVSPEPVREHAVWINDVLYPVKQAFSVATGIPRTEFTSQTARRLLARLGFATIGGSSRPAPSSHSPAQPAAPRTGDRQVDGTHGWPWEGQVQALFAAYLHARGWLITAMADTATKATGVDVLARRDGRKLGAEVKGWPSKTYADVRRAEETKKTQPTTQAGHWYAQAVMKALMLLDSHPDHESLVVLPDFARYRDLAHRTRTGLDAAGVQVLFVAENGGVDAGTWSP